MPIPTSRTSFLRSVAAAIGAPLALSAQAPQPFNLLVLGDSIAWGQGVAPGNRWRELLQKALIAGLKRPVNLITPSIHSGAVIGIGDHNEIKTGDNLYKGNEPSFVETPDELGGEIPSATPTILLQLDRFAHGTTPPRIDLCVVSASINDVGIERWLNPFMDEKEIDKLIDLHCHQHLTALLDRIRVLCINPNPNCVCVVVSYYQIISMYSQKLIDMAPGVISALFGLNASAALERKMEAFLKQQGALERLTERALNFHEKSDIAIGKAVEDANRLNRSAQSFLCVSPRITEQEAIYAGATDKRLWEVSVHDGDLDPDHRLFMTDDVADARVAACDRLFPRTGDMKQRRYCHVAALAHPTDAAARLNYLPAIWEKIYSRFNLPQTP